MSTEEEIKRDIEKVAVETAVDKKPNIAKDIAINCLIEAYGIQTKVGKDALLVMLDNAALMDKKQRDYGPANIADFGTVGVVIRMNDKFQRIKNLIKTGRTKRAANETIRDTFRDIANYAVIALMLDSGKWPKT